MLATQARGEQSGMSTESGSRIIHAWLFIGLYGVKI